jgi:lipoprotein-releasing system permease protein
MAKCVGSGDKGRGARLVGAPAGGRPTQRVGAAPLNLRMPRLFVCCGVNFPYFFATRITLRSPQTLARLGVWLALISVALGVAVMEIAVSVASGFEQAVQQRLVGFAAPIQLGPYLPWADDEARPLPRTPDYAPALRAQLPAVQTLAPFVSKTGILQSGDLLEGVVLKGVDSLWQNALFREKLVGGVVPAFGTDSTQRHIFISQKLANLLQLEVGRPARLFFLEGKVRARPVTIAGIYNTGFTELDQVIVFCDMRLLQRIQGWNADEVSGLDVALGTSAGNYQPHEIVGMAEAINKIVPMDQKARTIMDLHPDLFSWLELQHQNVWFILVLMVVVAVVNMAGAVLIQITERTRTIGILRTIGARKGTVRTVFLWNAFYLVSFGVLAGNAVGLGLLWLQQQTGLVRLNPDSYFVREVPVSWQWAEYLAINVGVVAVCTLAMWVPTWAINRILPARAIRMG